MRLTANVTLSELSFEKYNFQDSYMMVNVILASNEQFKLNSIKSLFDDLDRFAQRIAKSDIVKLTFEHHEFLRNHMAIDLILSPKNQYQDIQEAFASIFCKELHNMHEWDITKQYAYHDKEWLMALKEIWIPENFLKYPGLQLEMENTSSFIKSVELDSITKTARA